MTRAWGVGEVRSDIRDLRAEMIRRFEQIDGRLHHMDTRFTWLIGVPLATLLASSARCSELPLAEARVLGRLTA